MEIVDTPQLSSFLNSNNFVNRVEFFWGNDNCKGQVFRKQMHEYVSGRRIKCKVYVSARFFRGKWGAKTVHYTKDRRGRWRRSRAEVIYAAYAGNIFNSDCTLSNAVSGVEEKRNKVKATAVGREPGGLLIPLRVQRESFGSAHSVRHNGKNYDYFITITW